jgi:predicted transcriptional regulator
MTTTCVNPRCSCPTCRCTDCTCGGVAKLGDLERQVMNLFWEELGRELSGREVAELLPEYAYTTVATILDRLRQKGLVRRRTDGLKNKFSATGTGASHTSMLMREALGAATDHGAALKRFAQTVSASDAAVLRRALEELTRAGRGSP